MLISGLGAMIVISICGLSGFFVVADERRGHGAEVAERHRRRTTGSRRASTPSR
jgi:hypothetical protein